MGVGRAGADVSLWARDPDKNRKAVEFLRTRGVNAHAVVCDVSDSTQIDNALAITLKHHGRIDSLFANAGVAGGQVPFLSLSLEQWREVMKVDLDGAFLSLQAAARHMVERNEGGALVGVSSIISRFGAKGRAHYGAAKTSVEGLVRSIAVELAPMGIRCNALAPGWTETAMMGPEGSFGVSNVERLREATIQRTPVGRWAAAEDYAAVAAFLADPSLVFHTGGVVTVDGGYTVS
jgi:NAD(P)-dependent dehydrogenase (short-subunit alcohol dehydrogenase family)